MEWNAAAPEAQMGRSAFPARTFVPLLAIALIAAGAGNPRSTSAPEPSPPAWSYSSVGLGAGIAGIVISGDDDNPELFLSGRSEDLARYWYTLRPTPGGGLEPGFVSEQLPKLVVRLVMTDLLAAGKERLVVALSDGKVLIYDPRSKLQINSVSLAIGGFVEDLAVCDCDGDGAAEFIALTGNRLKAFRTDGSSLWSLVNSARSLAVGQMDRDRAYEIALSSGEIVDGEDLVVEWSVPPSRRVAAEDLDGDGRAELITAGDDHVRAYRVDLQLQKWDLPVALDSIAALGFGDVDGDRVVEVVVRNAAASTVEAYDGIRLTRDRVIEGQWFSGAADFALADLDGDGVPALIWAAGAAGSGPNFVFFDRGDWRAPEWRSPDLRDGFLGPRRGDLDGDGRPDLVVASRESNSSSGAVVVVFDAVTLAPLATSDPINFDRALKLDLLDADGDGDDEILLATSDHIDAELVVLDFDGAGFQRVWTNAQKPRSVRFASAAVADLDGDGSSEIVGGVEVIASGFEGPYLYAYDLASGDEVWRSEEVPSDAVTEVVVLDSDGDSVPEVLALASNGSLYVFDGLSGDTEAVIDGRFSALRPGTPGATGTAFRLGTEDGAIVTYLWDGSDYRPVDRVDLTDSRIDGFERRGAETWVGSAGRLLLFNGATLLWQSGRYGPVLGREILPPSPEHPGVFGAGSYSVHRFDLREQP